MNKKVNKRKSFGRIGKVHMFTSKWGINLILYINYILDIETHLESRSQVAKGRDGNVGCYDA